MINVEKNLITDQLFPYKNMTVEERNNYLNIISHCKDICDSENKIDNQSKCEIIELRLSKEDTGILFNGSISIGTDSKHENRSIRGEIHFNENEIIVDMHVTRLLNENGNKIYTVTDKFKLENDTLKRNSYYNYNMKNIYEKIGNEEMKGMLR